MRTRNCAGWALALTAVSIAASELWHWQASRSAPGMSARPGRGAQAIVVLGFGSRRHGRLHPMQKWRTDMAVRSLPRAAAGYVLIFSGGHTHGALVSEAETMAAYARTLHVPGDQILLETKATTTWENVSLALPMAETFDTIMIVSDPLHAARARRYVAVQRPDLAGRLVFADDYRCLERWWLKAGVVVRELAVLVAEPTLHPDRKRLASQSRAA
jgi:uncharacterized SAM-binding protein YcdF (DUF218 family)